jgi:hypothetical protein
MFRARRMMALNAMIERLREERNQAAASDEERAIAALLDAPSDADSDADNEATTVLNISAVLAHLEIRTAPGCRCWARCPRAAARSC